MQQILEELKSAEEGTPQKEKKTREEPYVFDAARIKKAGVSEKVFRNKGREPYIECKIRETAVEKETFYPKDPVCGSILRSILEVEQPATDGYLGKRLAKALGFGRTGTNIQRAVSYAVAAFYRDPMSIGGINSYWLNEEDSKDYEGYRAPSSRIITEIPAVEIMNVVKEVVEEEFSMPIDKIPTIAAKKLGFSGTGSKINEVVKAAIALLEQNGVIVTNNGVVTLQ